MCRFRISFKVKTFAEAPHGVVLSIAMLFLHILIYNQFKILQSRNDIGRDKF
jgi:hypothetical protein